MTVWTINKSEQQQIHFRMKWSEERERESDTGCIKNLKPNSIYIDYWNKMIIKKYISTDTL